MEDHKKGKQQVPQDPRIQKFVDDLEGTSSSQDDASKNAPFPPTGEKGWGLLSE